MSIDPNGELCSCGRRGCWETFASERATVERFHRVTAKQGLPFVGIQDLIARAKNGDPMALESIKITAEYLGEGISNLGIVYNLHHAHDDMARLAEILPKIKPYLLAITLNGMAAPADKSRLEILPIGYGVNDLKILTMIRDSGYVGPFAILNHTNEDAEARLRDNLDGLDWLVAQLDQRIAPPKPPLRTNPLAQPTN